ncbi:PAS domain S-box protein [Mesobacillus persicus]|uniref:PAS domain S-box protein n=1 Tax=Mesobacillus persicus TaxID=930146 RepID=UPI00147EB3CE|nr:PAS domain S-box protein [Mesobacillus persicus]
MDKIERKNIDRKLNEITQHFQSLYEHHPDAIFSINLSGEFTDVNPACEKISGFTSNELMELSFLELLIPRDQEKVISYFKRVLNGHSEHYECSIYHKDGSILDLNLISIPIIINQKVTGVFGIAKDITEINKLEQELHATQEELKNIIHQQLGFIFKYKKVDDQFIFTLADGQLLTEIGSNELVGQSVEKVFGKSIETSRMIESFQKAWEEKKSVSHEGKIKDIYYISRLTPLVKGDKVTEVIGSFVDITELKNVENTLSLSEERYRSVVEISPSLIVIHKNGNILYVNPSVLKLTGFDSVDQLVNLPITEIIHPVSQGLFHSRMKTYKDDVEDKYVEYQFILPNGREVYVEAIGKEITYNGEKATLSVGIDITERKEKERLLRKSEKLLAESQRMANLGSWEMNLLEGKLYWSEETYRIFGVSPEEFTPNVDTFYQFIPHDEREYVYEENENALRGKPFSIEHKIIRADGDERYVTQQAEVFFNQAGQATYMIGTIQDITDKRNVENELKRSEEKFRSMVQYASDIISIVDQHGVILYQSPSSERILGFKPEEIIGLRGFNNNHPNEIEKAEKVFNKVLNNPGVPIQTELMLRHKNGSWLYCEQTSTNLLDNPNVQGIVVNIRDITTQKKYFSQLEHLAYHDELTKLLNKRGLNDLLFREVQSSKENNLRSSILFLDLDNFKSVNDNLGHEVGDQLLVRISELLREVIGEIGTVSRFGGDEFVILLKDISNVNHVIKITGKIIDLFRQPFIIDQYQFYITTSIGIAIDQDDSDDGQSLLKKADIAMYKAKISGKNTYRIFDNDMKKNNERTFIIQNDLRDAIKNNEFVLYYQPRIRTEDLKIIGVEALIRWVHPKLGLISPGEFISIAEDSGLIGNIGEWVLETACKQLAAWSKMGCKDLTMSVNFSALQFLQVNLQETVKTIINKCNVDPQKLEIEITESAVIDQDVGLQENINKLKEIGFQIAIDDFGTGYSSLAYIKKFQVNTIKIDQSFLINIIEDKSNEIIVSAVIKLAQALGLNVVAEGVETSDQFHKLKEMDCKEVQGFFFSKPLPKEEVEKNFLM